MSDWESSGSPPQNFRNVFKRPTPKKEAVETTSEENCPRKGERCVGCGSDSAIRVHYGASSCHGCKAFFRRSVFEGRVYMCSADNNCDITNESRNRCRACRLQNCLDGGMNPKHVREERSKIERMPAGQSSSQTPTTSAAVSAVPLTPPSSSQPMASNSDCAVSEQEAVEKKIPEEHQLTLFVVALEKQTEQLTDEDVQDNDIMGAWSRDISLSFGLHHPQMVIKRMPINYECERIMEATDLYLSWYRSFVLHADWAMGIPDFRILPLADQTTLFKQNFMAFGWITYAYKCYELKNHRKGITLGNGAYIPYNEEQQKKLPARWSSTYGIVCKKLIDLIVRVMIEIELTEEEYCLIKTISLFQQDCILSEERHEHLRADARTTSGSPEHPHRTAVPLLELLAKDDPGPQDQPHVAQLLLHRPSRVNVDPAADGGRPAPAQRRPDGNLRRPTNSMTHSPTDLIILSFAKL
ncbi:unnamed protein product [Caenorhabditis auriculariae]|uniref:Nuclear receptor domain-containing protein n=1 Tax=Caenorhabditis auriculariae TaxID=2777116 RepID=A0A8S1I0F7_9PELO|nr:unnamed protein product [Caenorhabditis auriculariae]